MLKKKERELSWLLQSFNRAWVSSRLVRDVENVERVIYMTTKFSPSEPLNPLLFTLLIAIYRDSSIFKTGQWPGDLIAACLLLHDYRGRWQRDVGYRCRDLDRIDTTDHCIERVNRMNFHKTPARDIWYCPHDRSSTLSPVPRPATPPRIKIEERHVPIHVNNGFEKLGNLRRTTLVRLLRLAVKRRRKGRKVLQRSREEQLTSRSVNISPMFRDFLSFTLMSFRWKLMQLEGQIIIVQ